MNTCTSVLCYLIHQLELSYGFFLSFGVPELLLLMPLAKANESVYEN